MNTLMGERAYLVSAAALSAALGVGLGAYGSHGLAVEQSLVEIWKTGVSYQMIHALAALAAQWLASTRTGSMQKICKIAGWALLFGSWAFSGSLYFFVIDGIVPIQGLAPIGGMAMIAGWLMIAFVALRR